MDLHRSPVLTIRCCGALLFLLYKSFSGNADHDGGDSLKLSVTFPSLVPLEFCQHHCQTVFRVVVFAAGQYCLLMVVCANVAYHFYPFDPPRPPVWVNFHLVCRSLVGGPPHRRQQMEMPTLYAPGAVPLSCHHISSHNHSLGVVNHLSWKSLMIQGVRCEHTVMSLDTSSVTHTF